MSSIHQTPSENQLTQVRIPNRLESALALTARGFSVIPLDSNGSKKPRVKWKAFQTTRPTADQIRYWDRQWPGTNWAVITGAVSGIFVIDVDNMEALALLDPFELQPLFTVKTSRGIHLYFSYPDFRIRNHVGLLPSIDIRGEGGYVAAPYNLHKSGAVYMPSASIETAQIGAASPSILGFLRPVPRALHTPKNDYQTDNAKLSAAMKALSTTRAANYQSWLSVGMALYELGNEGLALWSGWSEWKPGECAEKWRTFGRAEGEKLTVASIYRWAFDDDPQWFNRYRAENGLQTTQVNDIPKGELVEWAGARQFHPDELKSEPKPERPAQPATVLPKNAPPVYEEALPVPYRNGCPDSIRRGIMSSMGKPAALLVWLACRMDENAFCIADLADYAGTHESVIKAGLPILLEAGILIELPKAQRNGRGRPRDRYALADGQTIKAAIQRYAIPRIIEKHFKIGDTVAPIKAFLMDLTTRPDAPAADGDAAQYADLIAAQPEYKKLIKATLRDFEKLTESFKNTLVKSYPDDWKIPHVRAWLAGFACAYIDNGGTGINACAKFVGVSPNSMGSVLAAAGREAIENEIPIELATEEDADRLNFHYVYDRKREGVWKRTEKTVRVDSLSVGEALTLDNIAEYETTLSTGKTITLAYSHDTVAACSDGKKTTQRWVTERLPGEVVTAIYQGKSTFRKITEDQPVVEKAPRKAVATSAQPATEADQMVAITGKPAGKKRAKPHYGTGYSPAFEALNQARLARLIERADAQTVMELAPIAKPAASVAVPSRPVPTVPSLSRNVVDIEAINDGLNTIRRAALLMTGNAFAAVQAALRELSEGVRAQLYIPYPEWHRFEGGAL